jgi:ribonuclease HI
MPNAHCDGGARGNPGPAGYGAVITDDAGHKLTELSEFLGNRTNNVAEYSGLLGVLAWALEHGHRRLRVVSDSELMVKQIQGKYKVNSPDLRPLWEEARRRIATLDRFEISHALRHKNKDADRLANEAMDRGMGRHPVPAPPGTLAAPHGTVDARSSASTAKAGAPGPNPRTLVNDSARRPALPASPPAMLRGFTRDGVVHLLGGATLPDGIFVKVIPE